ncbi:MAG TPA: hypothetical protein VEU08_10440 [Vicinamibacterales bacterium]|nr:hypothetical protein [Vicinamibacterales bacterium]
MTRLLPLVTSAVFATYMPFCAPAIRSTMPPADVQKHLSELWEAPGDDLSSRNLVFGPWGKEYAPDPHQTFTFAHLKTKGVSPGMTVKDEEGREWSVKQSPDEGKVEVTLSRILSAVGYHQPPVYYLETFSMTDEHGLRTMPGGRFRPKLKELKELGDWSFQQNPFVGTKPMQGLLVILMVFDSSDLKNSNNTLYEFKPKDGKPERWYVVRDMGTALGETGRIAPQRNDPDLLARQTFIEGVHGSFVEFGYHGWHQELFRGRITTDDVQWGCGLLAKLSDRQWEDAFHAGGYDSAVAGRFIDVLKKRIAQGLAVGPEVTATRQDF